MLIVWRNGGFLCCPSPLTQSSNSNKMKFKVWLPDFSATWCFEDDREDVGLMIDWSWPCWSSVGGSGCYRVIIPHSFSGPTSSGGGVYVRWFEGVPGSLHSSFKRTFILPAMWGAWKWVIADLRDLGRPPFLGSRSSHHQSHNFFIYKIRNTISFLHRVLWKLYIEVLYKV